MPSEARTVSHPDPRPETRTTPEGVVVVVGWRCEACGRPSATPVHWCPRCRRPVHETTFGPGGTVWSSTVVRVPLPGREPPSVLAYVDLDDGPRVLAHVESRAAARLHVGDRVQLVPAGADGDIGVEPTP